MSYYLEAYFVEDFEQALGTVNFSHYDAVRQVLRPEYRNLPDAEIDALLQRVLGGMSPEEVEGFWDTLKDAGKAALGVAKQVAPTLLPVAGGALGTLVGGPVGTALGSKLGQMGAQLLTNPQAPRGPAAAPASAAAAGATAPVPAGGTSAVAQLMALLKNPDLLKSLLGQVLGGAGESTVLVGPRAMPIPFGAMMNALESLAAQAAIEAAEAIEDEDDTEAVRQCPRICRRRNISARARQQCRRLCPVGRIRRVPPRRPVAISTQRPMVEPGERPPAYGEEPLGEEPYGEEPYGDEESFEAISYLEDESGNLVADPANPDERAQRVLELLNEASEAYVSEEYDPVTEWLIEAELL
jgi:hypothetical protein